MAINLAGPKLANFGPAGLVLCALNQDIECLAGCQY